MSAKCKSPIDNTINQSPTTRVAKMLYDLVLALPGGPSTARANCAIARGVALLAQQAKLSPRAFDCANGADALAAIAHTASRDELVRLGNSSAQVLSARWSAAIYLIGTKLHPSLSLADVRRFADTSTDPVDRPADDSWPPKLFGKFMS
jgi:hypothetical protein